MSSAPVSTRADDFIKFFIIISIYSKNQEILSFLSVHKKSCTFYDAGFVLLLIPEYQSFTKIVDDDGLAAVYLISE